VREAAAARLGDLLPRLAHLTIEVPAGLQGATVLVDKRPVDPDRLATAMPLDPTSHRIEVHRGSALVEVQGVTLREGERRTVTLGMTAPAMAAQPAAEPAPRSHAWAWALVGALAVGVTTTAVLATRDGPSPPAGNVDTWKLGSK
jgi:hypothetical protein